MQHRKLYHEINFHIRCPLEAKKKKKKTYVSFMLAEESHKEIFNLNYNSVSLPLIYLLCVL